MTKNDFEKQISALYENFKMCYNTTESEEVEVMRELDTINANKEDYANGLLDEIVNLPRYHNVNDSYVMVQSDLGLWVKYADIKQILNKRICKDV